MKLNASQNTARWFSNTKLQVFKTLGSCYCTLLATAAYFAVWCFEAAKVKPGWTFLPGDPSLFCHSPLHWHPRCTARLVPFNWMNEGLAFFSCRAKVSLNVALEDQTGCKQATNYLKDSFLAVCLYLIVYYRDRKKTWKTTKIKHRNKLE